jgi:hypothetical protein
MNMKALSTTSVVLVFCLFPLLVGAQSRDKNKPTPMKSAQVSGVSGKQDNRELYYSFTAGPGDLVVTLVVEGLSGRADRESLVRLTFYDQDFHEVGKFDRQSGLNGESKRHVEKYNFAKETPLVMRLTFETGASKYRISLGGDIAVGKPSSPSSASNEVFQLPKAGVLTVKMRDGSIHTINLPDVQDAKIETESPQKQ